DVLSPHSQGERGLTEWLIRGPELESAPTPPAIWPESAPASPSPDPRTRARIGREHRSRPRLREKSPPRTAPSCCPAGLLVVPLLAGPGKRCPGGSCSWS